MQPKLISLPKKKYKDNYLLNFFPQRDIHNLKSFNRLKSQHSLNYFFKYLLYIISFLLQPLDHDMNGTDSTPDSEEREDDDDVELAPQRTRPRRDPEPPAMEAVIEEDEEEEDEEDEDEEEGRKHFIKNKSNRRLLCS
jgi:hypothetical protein